MFTWVLSVVSLFYLIYYFVTRKNDYWKKRNVPGPKPLLFFGNIKPITLRQTSQGEVFKEFYDKYPNEKVVGVFRMLTPSLMIRDLDVIKSIVIKDFDMFMARGIEFDPDGLGANLFHADGQRWQVLRNKFTPIFTSGKLKNMMYLMTERGEKFIEYLKSTSQNKEQDIYPLIQKYTMSNISACAFGLDIEMNDTKIMDELQIINTLIFKLNRAFDLDLLFPGILNKLPISLFPKRVKKFFYQLTNSVISERNGKPSNRKDFMDLLLELKEQKQMQGSGRNKVETINVDMSEGLIAAQAFIFYAAGYETSATTMSYMLFELAKHPDIQNKLTEEIDEVLKKTNGKVTYECLQEMTYLSKVLDETLRKYPLVEPLQRVAVSNYKIPGTDVVIEKDMMVFISPLAIHHDEEYYPDPEKFDPERFSPENSRDRHPCAYMPFGLGPRNCIGMRFANLQTKIGIVNLLSNFRLEPSKTTPEIKFDPNDILMNPLNGVHLKLVPRVTFY